MAKGKELKVNFKFEKSTAGSHRFTEVDSKGKEKKIADGAAVGTLYLRKSAIGDTAPKELEVTITSK